MNAIDRALCDLFAFDMLRYVIAQRARETAALAAADAAEEALLESHRAGLEAEYAEYRSARDHVRDEQCERPRRGMIMPQTLSTLHSIEASKERLADVDPHVLGTYIARLVDDYLHGLIEVALGLGYERSPDDKLAATPIAQRVEQLARWAQTGAGMELDDYVAVDEYVRRALASVPRPLAVVLDAARTRYRLMWRFDVDVPGVALLAGVTDGRVRQWIMSGELDRSGSELKPTKTRALLAARGVPGF